MGAGLVRGRSFAFLAAAAVVVSALLGSNLWAQEIGICERSQAECTTDSNRGRIGLISGSARGTYIKIADDIRRAVEAYEPAAGADGDRARLRVVPMVGLGSVQNMDDLLYFSNTDVGLVQADLLVLLKEINTLSGGRRFADVIERIRYLAPVYNEEVHVVCRRGACGRFFGEVVDGLIVNLGPRGSGTALTARLIARRLGFLEENFRYLSYSDALGVLRNPDSVSDADRIDVMFYVAGKPVSLFQGIDETESLELMELTERPEGLEIYVDAVITEEDGYEGLLGSRARVRTLAVPAVLAVYGGTYRNRERAQNLKLFCQALVAQQGWLRSRALDGGAHPKWGDWEPAAALDGLWVRHPFMEDALAGR